MPQENILKNKGWFPKGYHSNPKTEFKKGNIPWDKGKKLPGVGFKKGHKGYKFWLGKKFSEETKQKMSKARLGKRGIGGMTGKNHSEKTKKRISKIMKGRPSPKGMLGKHHSEETKSKIGLGNKGKKYSKETKEKMSKSHEGIKCNFWKGGISYEPYSTDWTATLKRAIRERDHYICQLCSEYGDNVHHIDYDKKNCSPDNLITLCRSCNSKVNSNREYWSNYFKTKWKI